MICMEAIKISFSDIDWGEDEATNDEALERYFVEFPGYEKILAGEKRYIIGRKGTGKSAILQKIRLLSKSDPKTFSSNISLRDFPLTDFKSLGDRRLQDKSKYVSAWKFLLYTEIANLMRQDNSIKNTQELELLNKFLDDNFPEGISIAETIGKLRQNENKIGMVLSILSGEHSSSSHTEIISQVHYNKAVKNLEHILASIQTDSAFILLIDELDEGYQEKNANLNLVILALLRAANEIYNFFKASSIKCIPVLALRSDIFDSLEDNDLNKLDDYVLRLNWTTSEKKPWSLKQIAVRRIAATIEEKYPESQIELDKCWDLVACNSSAPNGLWQYICNLTFSRPRDIIKLLKYCSENNGHIDALTFENVQAIEEIFSDWFYREFRDEIQSFLPCWKPVINCLSEIGQGKAPTADLVTHFEANDEIKKWCDENNKVPLDIIKLLFNYSVIGCINRNGRWIFKYKDDSFELMQSYPNYCIHFGFCRKLRIPKSYDKSITEALSRYN